MKCPQLVHRRPIKAGWDEAFFGDCLKEECAWWDFDQNLCLFRSAQMDLARIRYLLEGLVDKMPVARE